MLRAATRRHKLARDERNCMVWFKADGLEDALLRPNIVGVGTATAGTSYSQQQVLDAFQVSDRRIQSLFLNSQIGRRYLTLPEADQNGVRRTETQAELLDKHRRVGIELGTHAIEKCLTRAQAEFDDIRYLCC